VSHDFVQALKALPQAKVVAVGASSLEKAEEFAETHAIDRAYGSYEEVVGDAEVQVVYVGTLHAFHKVLKRFLPLLFSSGFSELTFSLLSPFSWLQWIAHSHTSTHPPYLEKHALLAIEAGKHVLVENPWPARETMPKK